MRAKGKQGLAGERSKQVRRGMRADGDGGDVLSRLQLHQSLVTLNCAPNWPLSSGALRNLATKTITVTVTPHP